jgi:hypothetical protein
MAEPSPSVGSTAMAAAEESLKIAFMRVTNSPFGCAARTLIAERSLKCAVLPLPRLLQGNTSPPDIT